MRTPKILIMSFWLAILSGNCPAKPVTIIRADPKSVDWANASELIVQSFRKSLNPPADAKIVPLFIAVQLMLGDPVSEFGARLTEIAFVYSENIHKGDTPTRHIYVLVRSPYEVREWKWEPILKMPEGEDAVKGSVILKVPGDRYGEISNYARKVTEPANSGEHIIHITTFEESIKEIFGKVLDNAALLRMINKNK